MIEANGLSLVYSDHGREVYACKDVSLRIDTSEFLGILGPSGSGKSSLLYLLSGLKDPSHGDVLYNGSPIHALSDEERSRLRRREFGFVFQQPYLLGYMTALENVLSVAPDKAEQLKGRALDLLDALGLAAKADRLPHTLSGGERQRVCIARALVTDPKVIFADEPTAALDHKNGVNVMEILNRHRGNGALVMVTHDPSMLEHANRIVRIQDGELVVEGS